MGIKNSPMIKIIKKNMTATKLDGSLPSLEEIKKQNEIIDANKQLWDTIAKTKQSKDLKNTIFIPINDVFNAYIPAFGKKQKNNLPLRNTDYYTYSKPSNETRPYIKTLHYHIRHYTGSKNPQHFPIALNFNKDGQDCQIKITAKEYAGSNPGIGHEVCLYQDKKLTARIFLYRFGDIRTDIFDENGKIIPTREGLATLDAFLRFYYTNSEKKNRILLQWLKL